MDTHVKKEWEITRSETGPNLILFQARYDWVKNPRNDQTIKAIVLESPDWGNIVALTPEKKLIVVEQHRYGSGRTSVELPAGIIETGETPQQGAMRELQEETGYTSTQWQPLGRVEPNPAFLTNHCYFWLARDVIKTATPQLDVGESIVVKQMSIAEVRHEISVGRMANSLSLLALSRVFDLREVAVE